MSTRSELVQTYWPVVVSVAAAIWATVAFTLKELPLLEARVDGTSDLTWVDLGSPHTCRASFAVSLKNSGTTGVSVGRVRVRTWLLDVAPPQDAAGQPSYVDVPRLLGAAASTDVSYGADTANAGAPLPLVASYYAGMSYSHVFEWDVPKTERRRFHVLAELFPSSSSERTEWYFTRWSPACDVPPAQDAGPLAELIMRPATSAQKVYELTEKK